MMYEPNEIAAKILKYRAMTGLTQKQFAERIGIYPKTLITLMKTGRCRKITRAKIELLINDGSK